MYWNALACLLALLLSFLWLIIEWQIYKRDSLQRQSHPSFKKWVSNAHKKKASNKSLPPLIFSIFFTLIFSFWESILGFLLQSQLHWIFAILGGVLFIGTVGHRLYSSESSESKKLSDVKTLNPLSLVLIVFSIQLVARVKLSPLLLLWIFYRSSFLKKTPRKKMI